MSGRNETMMYVPDNEQMSIMRTWTKIAIDYLINSPSNENQIVSKKPIRPLWQKPNSLEDWIVSIKEGCWKRSCTKGLQMTMTPDLRLPTGCFPTISDTIYYESGIDGTSLLIDWMFHANGWFGCFSLKLLFWLRIVPGLPRAKCLPRSRFAALITEGIHPCLPQFRILSI